MRQLCAGSATVKWLSFFIFLKLEIEIDTNYNSFKFLKCYFYGSSLLMKIPFYRMHLSGRF